MKSRKRTMEERVNSRVRYAQSMCTSADMFVRAVKRIKCEEALREARANAPRLVKREVS